MAGCMPFLNTIFEYFSFFFVIPQILISRQKCIRPLFWIAKKIYDKIFSYNPLLKTNSNQEHNIVNIHLPNPESIEQVVKQIFHSVPCVESVWLVVHTSRIFASGWVLGGDSGFAPDLDFVFSKYHLECVILTIYRKPNRLNPNQSIVSSSVSFCIFSLYLNCFQQCLYKIG